MKIAIFCHSILSDYNYPATHFLRGISSELFRRGNEVVVFERQNSASYLSAIKEAGKAAISEFKRYYPFVITDFAEETAAGLKEQVKNTDLILVDVNTDPHIISLLKNIKKAHSLKIILLDSAGVVISEPDQLASMPLDLFDGLMAGGTAIKKAYERIGFPKPVSIVHPAVDVEVFQPRRGQETDHVAFICDWGNKDRTDELEEFLIKPVKDLRIKAKVYGAKYPKHFKRLLSDANIEYMGWLPDFKLPEVVNRFSCALHIPTKIENELIPGVPGIKLMELLACGAPVLSAEWKDSEKLFNIGREFLMAKDGYEMKHYMLEMVNSTLKEVIAGHAVKAINTRHSCKVRVDLMEKIFADMGIVGQELCNEN